jgi:hypothetical protein
MFCSCIRMIYNKCIDQQTILMLFCFVYIASYPRPSFPFPQLERCPPAPNFPFSHSPYTLPSSVSRKPCICHSYENTRGVGVFLPFSSSSIASQHTPLCSALFSCAYELQISQLLSFDIHPNWWGYPPLTFKRASGLSSDHFCYSGRPKMIVGQQICRQSTKRMRKLTP